MKQLFLRIIVLLTACSINAQLWLVDPLEAIYPDENQLTEYSNRWKADFPKGAVADVNILVKIPKGEMFTITILKDGIDLKTSVLNRLIDVPVEQNTGIDSRTEQFIGKINPHVVRRAPFKIFEVLEPLKSNQVVSYATYTAFRLVIPPSLLVEGNHKVKIQIKSQNFEEEGVFKIKVHSVQLPDLAESNFFYTNWFNLNNMEKHHTVERWSEPWFSMLDSYAQLMAQGRQNSITIPNELFQVKDDGFVLDEEKMLRYINVFREHGFKYFESPHLMYRGDNDDWGDPELKVVLTKKRYYKENGKRDIEKLAELIKYFADKNNLTENWLQHIADEPTETNSKCYKDVVNQVKAIFPEIKIMEATNDRDGIAGAIDIWCPLINDFQENESFFRDREEKGEKILVYTCLVPGGKWLNRTLDMEKLRQVYFGWGASHYNTAGYLHWGLNQYYADPYKKSVVKHPSPAAGANNYLPAGDTHIIYPGKDGPLSSLRFEAHRIGCEDYDLLQLLKKRNLNLYKSLVNNLFRSYTDYNLSLKQYRKTKKKLLKAL